MSSVDILKDVRGAGVTQSKISAEKTAEWRFHYCTAMSLYECEAIVNTDSPLLTTGKWTNKNCFQGRTTLAVKMSEFLFDSIVLSFNRVIIMPAWWKRSPWWWGWRDTVINFFQWSQRTRTNNKHKRLSIFENTLETFNLLISTHPTTTQRDLQSLGVSHFTRHMLCVCMPLTGCCRQQWWCDPRQPSSNRFPLRRSAPCSRLFIVRACQSFPVKNHCRHHNIQPHSPGWHFRQWITGWRVTQAATHTYAARSTGCICINTKVLVLILENRESSNLTSLQRYLACLGWFIRAGLQSDLANIICPFKGQGSWTRWKRTKTCTHRETNRIKCTFLEHCCHRLDFI